MDKDAGHMTLNIRKRPWTIRLSRTLWILWLAFWAEFAVGSWLEREPQAYNIAMRVLLVSILLGLALYFWRRRSHKVQI